MHGDYLLSLQVTVCKEGNECPESVTLVRDDSLLMTEFTSSVPLDLCTDYSLHIKPLWPATDLYEKVMIRNACHSCHNHYHQVVSFRTLSPPLSNLTRHLRGSSVQVQGKQVVVVRWAAVTCAAQYKVYAKYQAWTVINNADTDKYSCNNVMLHSAIFVQQAGVKCHLRGGKCIRL